MKAAQESNPNVKAFHENLVRNDKFLPRWGSAIITKEYLE